MKNRYLPHLLVSVALLSGCFEDEIPCAPLAWFPDSDGDGFGSPYQAQSACEAPAGFVADSTDCDDSDPDQFPGAIWFADEDGDGFGNPEQTLENCIRPTGWVSTKDDCDDADASKNPARSWYMDADDDGYGDAEQPVDSCSAPEGAVDNPDDCDDTSWRVHPSAQEVCDSIDNDCDEKIDDEDDSVNEFSQVARFRDDDGDGWGTSEVIGRACPSSDFGAGFAGDCDDKDPSVHPGQMDWKNGEDTDCDGVVDGVDMVFSQTGIRSDHRYLNFGRSIVTSDVDGDGWDELLVGEVSLQNGRGGVRYLPGRDWNDLHDATGAKEWYGPEEYTYTGDFTGIHPDIDGDGHPEIFVTYRNQGEYAGRVYHLSAAAPSEQGLEEVASNIWDGSSSYCHLGSAYLAVDDIMLLGGRGESSDSYLRNGLVFLVDSEVLKNNTALDEVPFIAGTKNYDYFGFSMFSIDDTDGDGAPEFGIAAPYGDGPDNIASSGDIYLFNASQITTPGLLASDAHRRISGSERAQLFGYVARSAGDVNDDGYGDIISGSPYSDPVSKDEGGAWVVLGAFSPPSVDTTADAHWTFIGTERQGYVGRSIAGPGDTDGDGAGDVFIGASHVTTRGQRRAGAIYGISSYSDSGTWIIGEDETDMVAYGETTNDYLGYAMTPAGDVNGDGLADLWAGSPQGYGSWGAVYLMYGSPAP